MIRIKQSSGSTVQRQSKGICGAPVGIFDDFGHYIAYSGLLFYIGNQWVVDGRYR